jgi:DNA-binding PadR family transcriptional regulator
MTLNSTAACVLGLLDIGPPPPDRDRWERDGSMSGAEAWSAVERSVGGFWSMTRSQVYQELRKLTAAELVTVADARYTITPNGRAAVREWFNEFALGEPRDEQVRSPIALSVFFGHYLPTDLLERVVREHALRTQRRLDVLQTIDAALENDRSLPGATLQRAILAGKGAIEWTNDVLDRIANVANTANAAPARGKRRSR